MGTELNGPRRLVLLNLLKQSQPKSSSVTSVQPGQVRFESSSLPGLTPGKIYTASFEQTVRVSSDNPLAVLTSSRQFEAPWTPFSLDPSFVHSVYPPPGHADYWSM